MKLPKSLTTVTRLSKTIALIMFIALPFIGFYLGMKYQQEINQQNQNSLISKMSTQTFESITNPKTYINKTYNYSFQYSGNLLAAPLCPQNSSPDNEIMISTEKVNCDPGFSTNGKLYMWVNEYDGNTLQMLLKPDADLGPNPPSVSVSNKILVDGVVAKEIYWTNNTHEVIIVRNNKTYRLTDLDHSNVSAQVFAQILSTFKFTN